MATLRDLARLAAAAYTRRTQVGRFRLEPGAPSALGFRSSVWRDELTDERVLCVRGTADPFDMVQDARLLFGREPRAWRVARDWIERERSSDRSLVLTGHSLGGAFASALGAEFELPTVTFNAPGMVDALARSFDVLPDWVRPDRANVLNICAAEDWIWRLSGQGLGREHVVLVRGGPPSMRRLGPTGALKALRAARRVHGSLAKSVKNALALHAMEAFRPLIQRGEGVDWDTSTVVLDASRDAPSQVA